MGRPSAISLVIALALVGTLFVAVTSATSFGRTEARAPAPAAARDEVSQAPPLEPVERFIGEPRTVSAEPSAAASRRDVAPRPASPPGFGVVRVRSGRTVRLYGKPWGRVISAAGARTRFGSPTVMSVVRTRGRWLAVTTTAMGNGKIAWVRADAPSIDRGRVRMAISVDLSERKLELRRSKRLVKSLSVAIGRPGSATPKGRFAVTDKIPGSRYGSYYGCCILALNGTQPNTPAGWRGGNRLAIHGTNAPGSIGTPSSAGCLRASDADLRTLMRRVPLGTPVFVHG
ncbi:MAG TPA: L,D-transpeptidase, partial [Thermoleophilaceae bacterium]|jgi:lipoprotein-anchoring transpeptidase ErfK/SrfK